MLPTMVGQQRSHKATITNHFFNLFTLVKNSRFASYTRRLKKGGIKELCKNHLKIFLIMRNSTCT